MKILAFSKTKLLSLGAIIVVASGLGFVKVQCSKFEKIKVRNMELKQEVSKLAFDLAEKQSEVNTLNLIRKGPAAIAAAANKIPRKIKPKPGKTPIPAAVVEKGDITVIEVDPDFLAELVEDSKMLARKEKRIGELVGEVYDANKKRKRATRTRALFAAGGFVIGTGVTLIVVKLVTGLK